MHTSPRNSFEAPPVALIIGGTAAYGLDLSPYHPLGKTATLETPYGLSPAISFLRPDPESPPVAFCSRHGADQLARSAAFVNHRAIVWAAEMLGVSAIFSWNGTGAIASYLEVGDLVVPDDFIDFTRARVATFGHEDLPSASGPAFHPVARAAILPGMNEHQTQSSDSNPRSPVHDSGTYVCTEGPRLETASEIAFYHAAGADLVGMTLSPELFLAQELGIPYASLCYITNYATGRAGNRPPRRQFGPEVAHTCLPILLNAACRLQPGT
ncbi:MAG: MTAP family purine nucleoside phosphorylase [Caldilineales bacterium]|nr:MTAP family purine nucleoside phosphorylase [Caldilineales bacterium]